MGSLTLSEAREERRERMMFDAIDQRVDLLLSAKTVGPHARYKLRNLLKYYAKKPHPFRACYKDNVKRFGPRGAAQVCATLKDIIRGTTKWRKGGRKHMSDEGLGDAVVVDFDMPEIDDETMELIEMITDDELVALVHGGGDGEG